MAVLDTYKAKRNFKRTGEPEGGAPHSDRLAFVVQKHDASHLHYDFRLEMKGVLKSWAVPKGPSMNPDDHRLAMAVEDHPFDYKDFEGIIPEGQYGGGTVIVWDRGTYEPAFEAGKTKAEQEHWLLSNYYKNALKITLHGEKLKGDFILIRNFEKGDNAWILAKADDRHARKRDVTLQDHSVISGLTIGEMAQRADARVWQSNRANDATTEDEAPVERPNVNELMRAGRKSPFPSRIKPMLCTLTKEPVISSEYTYELKWDGYRLTAYVHKGKVRLDSRGGLDYTDKYPPLVKALKDLNRDLVMDGEVVVFDDEGLPSFDRLQKYRVSGGELHYCVFDILWVDGYDLTGLTLVQRKRVLESLLPAQSVLEFSQSFADGQALFDLALQKGLEGIVAKKKDSQYLQNDRSYNWLKTPARKRQEFVIGGWAESDKGRSFRSLLFGAYKNGKLEWIGRSGGGYKEKEMPSILKMLRELEMDKSPFANKVLDTKGAAIHWVKPQLVANFEFATWTASGRIRKPATFLGFRQDKKAEEVVREVAEEADVVKHVVEDRETATRPHKLSPVSNWNKIYDRRITSEKEFRIDEHTLRLTNIEQEPWPAVTKADLVMYYHEVAPFLLPYLRDRPLSLHIKDGEPMKPGFYIKDMEGQQPEFVDIFQDRRRIPKPGKRNLIEYGVCNNEASLLYFVNLGCIDMNPWSARLQQPATPDYISLDLDPSGEDFTVVIQTAVATRKVLDELKLQAVVKTSGKTGLHIFVPCTTFTNAEAKSLGKRIYDRVAQAVPGLVTDVFAKDHREGKLFFDYTLNDYADTLASVYSVRPYHIPTVSTPLAWKEVNDRLDPSAFTMKAVIERLAKKGDLFKDLLDDRIRKSNTVILRKLLDA